MMGAATIDTPLPIAVVGCDFRVGSTQWRNGLLMAGAERAELARKLKASGHVTGFVVLQTCNRVEWILTTPKPSWAGELARAQMAARWVANGFPAPLPRPYLHVGEQAAMHLVRVALGLESFVRGEREIAGQLNRAFSQARKAALISPELNALQTVLGRVVKRVGRLTTFGARARGVHGLALDAVCRSLELSSGARAGRGKKLLVIGMGEIGRKAASLAQSAHGFEVIRANRTIAPEHVDHWRPLSEVPALLPEMDAVVLATGAPEPILRAVHLADACRGLPVVDMGTPPQAEPGEAGVRLFGLDDLLIGRAGSDEDLQEVLALADDAVSEYRMALRKREVAGLLRATQDHYDRFAYTELPELLRVRGAGELTPELRAALRAYTRDIVAEIERAVGG